jgi:hypothetical protein
MKFRFSDHAAEEIERRGVGRANVDGVLDAPAQIVEERSGRRAYQSRVNFADGEYLVRVLIDPADDPPVVLTAYRTSRIAKYWRTK